MSLYRAISKIALLGLFVLHGASVLVRLLDGDISRLCEEISLIRLAESSGVALTKQGKERVGRCPFHEDIGESLVITDEMLFVSGYRPKIEMSAAVATMRHRSVGEKPKALTSEMKPASFDTAIGVPGCDQSMVSPGGERMSSSSGHDEAVPTEVARRIGACRRFTSWKPRS